AGQPGAERLGDLGRRRPSAGLRALAPRDDVADRPRSRRTGPEGAGPRAVEDGARQAGRADAAELPDVLGPAGPGLGESGLQGPGADGAGLTGPGACGTGLSGPGLPGPAVPRPDLHGPGLHGLGLGGLGLGGLGLRRPG